MTGTIEVIVGAFIAILTTIAVESLRRPRLTLSIKDPVDRDYQQRFMNALVGGGGGVVRHARFLVLDCTNQPLPWFARWMSRDPAMQCQGTISFHHVDGQNVFGRVMPVRWSKSPEPVPIQIATGTGVGYFFDPQRMTEDSRRDIHAGDSEELAVVARFDDDDECYGWSNLNYLSGKSWRISDWKLPTGRYLVKVTVASAGQRCEAVYRVINDVSRQDFRLMTPLQSDKVAD